jgi:hypothetical protein
MYLAKLAATNGWFSLMRFMTIVCLSCSS